VSPQAELETLVSPYTGVVHALSEFLRAPDEPRLASFGARLAGGAFVLEQDVDEVSGGATRAAAIAEAAERYSACFVPVERLRLSSAADLDRAADPASFALFHPLQYTAAGFPFVPFDERAVVRWVEGVDLADGSSAWLPAQLVYLPPQQGEPAIAYSTSSGLAAAPTPSEAILRGLLELVERDAFMLAWSNRLSLPLLEWSGDPELDRVDRELFAPTRLRYSAVDAGAFFGIPTVIGVVHGPVGELGALGVGASCAVRVADAVQKALTEAFSVREHVRDALVEDPDLIPATPAAVTTFDDHMRFYGTGEAARRAAFLDASRDRRSTLEVAALPGATAEARVRQVLRRLAGRGVSAYAVDVTAPDIREAGLHVVRVICPELCPLDVIHRARFLGGRRLYSAAYEAGLAPRPFEPAELNDDPHPFP
jgi:ribosomal protein S12 methylthiotransferase accessory factor